MSIENIENHMAYTCKCGGVNFALLKSGGIECNKCGEALDGVHWGNAARDLANERDALAAKLDELQRQEPAEVMTWNDMYRKLDFYNGRPIHEYSPTALMQVEIEQLRANLYAAPKALEPDERKLVRNAALEEAAQKCDAEQFKNENNGCWLWEARNAAIAIRNLKEPT